MQEARNIFTKKTHQLNPPAEPIRSTSVCYMGNSLHLSNNAVGCNHSHLLLQAHGTLPQGYELIVNKLQTTPQECL